MRVNLSDLELGNVVLAMIAKAQMIKKIGKADFKIKTLFKRCKKMKRSATGWEKICKYIYKSYIWQATCVLMWPCKDAHVLNPKSCEYVTLCGKRAFADVIKLKFVIKRLFCMIIPGGPNVTTKVFIKGVRDLKVLYCWLWRWRKRPQAKECGGL